MQKMIQGFPSAINPLLSGGSTQTLQETFGKRWGDSITLADTCNVASQICYPRCMKLILYAMHSLIVRGKVRLCLY